MSGSFEITPALARTLSRRTADDALVAMIEAGDSAAYDQWARANRPDMLGRAPNRFARPTLTARLIGPHGEVRRQKVVRDRAASLGRKRTMGGSGAMPHAIRSTYSEGERAALSVIALEVKRRGLCDWPIDKIAAVAGVSKRTVQYALATAETNLHLKIQRRPLKGARNRTNLYTIISDEWLLWLKKGPSLASIDRAVEADRIGCKTLHGTEKGSFNPENSLSGGAFFWNGGSGGNRARGSGGGAWGQHSTKTCHGRR